MNNFIKMATMFITELAEKGATEDELWEAIQFSSELIDLSKKHRIGDMTNKYGIGYFDRQTDKAVTALGTYKDPNLTWTAEELGIKVPYNSADYINLNKDISSHLHGTQLKEDEK